MVPSTLPRSSPRSNVVLVVSSPRLFFPQIEEGVWPRDLMSETKNQPNTGDSLGPFGPSFVGSIMSLSTASHRTAYELPPDHPARSSSAPWVVGDSAKRPWCSPAKVSGLPDTFFEHHFAQIFLTPSPMGWVVRDGGPKKFLT